MPTAGYANALRHLFIWSPDIIQMKGVDALAKRAGGDRTLSCNKSI
jgi:hypothetical protein